MPVLHIWMKTMPGTPKDIRWQQRFSNYNKALAQLMAAIELSYFVEFTKLQATLAQLKEEEQN